MLIASISLLALLVSISTSHQHCPLASHWVPVDQYIAHLLHVLHMVLVTIVLAAKAASSIVISHCVGFIPSRADVPTTSVWVTWSAALSAPPSVYLSSSPLSPVSCLHVIPHCCDFGYVSPLWILYWVPIAVFMNDGSSAYAMSLNRIVAFCRSSLVVWFMMTFDFTAINSGTLILWMTWDTPSIGTPLSSNSLFAAMCSLQ